MKANLGFTGIATFGRAPHLSVESVRSGTVAVVGVPYDGGAGFWPGTRFGPRAIRDMSTRFPFFTGEDRRAGYWDMHTKRRLLAGVPVVDCGDVDVVYQDTEYVMDGITETVRGVLRREGFPLVLGGDHSITFPVLRAFEAFGPLELVHIDAHMDYRDSVVRVKHGHASPIRRAAELPFVGQICSMGLRGIRADEDDWRDAAARGNRLISAHDWLERGTNWVLDQIPPAKHLYVTFDIDTLDPALAPGTGTPEPGGPDYLQVLELLQTLPSKGRIVGFDVVEVNPLLEVVPRTALYAARLAVEFLGAIHAAEPSL